MSNNLVTEKLTSLQIERHALSGICKFPEVLYELNYLNADSFSNNLHQTIFSILKQEIMAGNSFDRVTLGQKVKQLLISFKDDVDPFLYVSNLFDSQINQKGTINTVRELVKLKVLREIYSDTLEKQKFLISQEPSKMTLAEIINHVDGIDNKRINIITTEDEPQDLFASIETYLKELATNPLKEVGLITPFKQFNRFFGGLKSGGDGSYLFSARSSEGKSVLLFNLAKGISILNNCKILYLDSEMSLKMNQIRAGAAEAGINPWYLSTGQWVKNPDLANKVVKSFPEFNKYNGLFYHKYVPNKDIKELIGIARKWFYKCCGRGEKAMIVMDYLKIVGSTGDRNEWQKFGDHVSYLNELGATLDVCIAIAAQQNRTGNQNGIRLDDDTTIGGSDRINQFSRFGAIFRRKTIDEISDFGPQFGTHILKPIKYSRDTGEEDYNRNCYIKTTDNTGRTKYLQNYINYSIDNYHIEEKGTLRDIINHQNLTVPLTNNKNKDNQEVDL